MTTKSKKDRRRVSRRTLHYYWEVTKRHKFLAFGTLLATPAVVVVRVTLIPYIFASMIDRGYSAGPDSSSLIAVRLGADC